MPINPPIIPTSMTKFSMSNIFIFTYHVNFYFSLFFDKSIPAGKVVKEFLNFLMIFKDFNIALIYLNSVSGKTKSKSPCLAFETVCSLSL